MLRIVVTALVFVSLAMAADPVATVSTSGPLLLNGAALPQAGFSAWPLAAGDELVTTTTPALIQFPDGTRIVIGKNSRAKLGRGGLAGIDLVAGTVIYNAATASRVSMAASGRPVDLKSLAEGVVSINAAGKVTVRQKNGADEALMSALKVKKPHPRSPHEKDDDRDQNH